jgi:signal transduction histidine kinase
MNFSVISSPRLPWARPARAFSIRNRLLGLSLLAVLGGYALLIVTSAWLASQDRRAVHRSTAQSVREALTSAGRNPNGLDTLSVSLAQMISPNFLGWVETEQGIPYKASRQIRLFSVSTSIPLVRLARASGDAAGVAAVRAAGRTYLTSTTVVPLQGQPVRLRFLEDITDKLDQQRLVMVLLMVAAGLATLVTGLFLRPVLIQGLAPLDELGERMQAISSDTLDTQRVLVQAQPIELAPIASAFNDLLDRLSVSWERQRGFVNGVSHELRTPISLIGNYANRLRRRSPDLSEQQVEQLKLIEDEAGRMAKLVSDLLSLTRLEAQRTLMPFNPFDVSKALERVVDRLQERCAGRLRISFGATQGAHTLALGDGERLEQCIANLVENAMKYVPDSSPIVLRLDASLDRVVVHVIDQGPGVPDNEKTRIFERFSRGRRATAIPGSGIGLAVVRALMETMGGSVVVADAPHGGADFQLRLRSAAPLPAT